MLEFWWIYALCWSSSSDGGSNRIVKGLVYDSKIETLKFALAAIDDKHSLSRGALPKPNGMLNFQRQKNIRIEEHLVTTLGVGMIVTLW